MLTRPVINFLLFQVGWLVTVLTAARGFPVAGVAYALVWSALHLHVVGEKRSSELALIACAALLGFLVDSLLVLGGVMAFPDQAQLGYPSTVWMVGLWVMFSMTLRHSLGWLRGKHLLALVLGFLFGPLAYWSGSKLGAIELNTEPMNLLFVAVAWAASMALLIAIEQLSRNESLSRSAAGATE